MSTIVLSALLRVVLPAGLLLAAGCSAAQADSSQDLQAVHDRIFAEAEQLAAEGFHVMTGHIGEDRVEIGLITARDDHARFFRDRYGAVETELIATRLTTRVRTAIDGYRTQGRRLRVFYSTGGGARLVRVNVREWPGRVRVTVVERVPNGPRTLELRLAHATVRLSRPLGDRRVIDASTGRRVRPCSAPRCGGAPGR